MRGAGRAFMLCAMTGTGRRAWLPLAAAITANALHAAPARASAAEVALSVRNALTGEAVPARIQHGPPDQPMTPGKLDGTGRASLRVGPGRVDILATCEGFQPLATHVAPEAGSSLPVTLWMDPIVPPPELDRARIGRLLRPGHALVHGHVVDDVTRLAVPGARASFRGLEATTDASGGFSLLVPLAAAVTPEAPLDLDTLRVESSLGDRALAVPLAEGDVHLIVDLGVARPAPDARHAHQRDAAEMEQHQQPPAREPVPSGFPGTQRRLPEDRLPGEPPRPLLLVVPPPTSIRVGIGCACAACTGVEVMSLETYVKRGLNDEWIASWLAHSLRAGAIPYRSYGAWHVLNPRDPSYDICSTTCCQVNDADTSLGSDLAAERTAGILLADGSGAIMRSEYSAEVNSWDDPADGLSCVNVDLSCGDGFAGSPSAGWPCVADAPCAGRGCYGHGRGTCQWGTQRWAQAGALWPWIVDHYSNANGSPGNLRSSWATSPLQAIQVVPEPAALRAGQTTGLALDAINHAELPHARALLGASLWSAATGWISDPPNDALVSLAPGPSVSRRDFRVPPGTPDGAYDIWLTVRLDVDDDGLLTAADIVMDQVRATAALTVCSDPAPVGATLRVTRRAAEALTLSWTPPANATEHAVLRFDTPAGPRPEFARAGATGAWDDDAASGPLLCYLVAAANACGQESP